MEPVLMPEPKRRSALRLWLGTKYVRALRRIQWRTGGFRFGKPRPGQECPYRCASHATPLLRKLKDLDMDLQHNKVHNLSLAVPRLDAVVLRPGETLSYWRRIGPPTARRGYREGMQLKNGVVSSAVGGGLCQCSNLLYWMTLHTPLTVVERHRHGYDVFPDVDRTQPFGGGATCAYNYMDLMIRNDTEQTWRLHLWLTEDQLCGEWWSDAPQPLRYEVYDKEHWMQGEYWGGYTRHNVLFRRAFDQAGNQVADDYITENHVVMMYAPLLPEGAGCSGAPDGKEENHDI